MDLLGKLGQAEDRRDGSDELALLVDGPEARHHLSRLRANVLRPLRFGPGLRVLDAYGESGVLARHLAERGAEVVCLSGSAQMAQAAEARCRGLDGVTVLPAGPEAFEADGGFDVVVCVGTPALGLIARLAELVRQDGALVLAYGNPVGIHRLVGAPRLQGAGATPQPPFEVRRRLCVFPDHLLATAIVDERAYDGHPGAEFVDQVVRWPCRRDPAAPLYVGDDRAAHRALLEGGLGPEVANSHLLVSGRTPEAVDRLVDPEARAWVFTGDRRRRFLGWKVFGSDLSEPVRAERVEEGPATVRSGWLGQTRTEKQEWRVGPTVEQLALAACGEGPDALGAVLGRWADHLRALECEPGGDPHPFRYKGTSRWLPADHLDVNLPNFVVDADGGLQYVDDEWQAPSPVDADLVRTRALWWFAVDLVHRGVAHPWPPGTTVNQLVGRLAACAGEGRPDVDVMLAGEAALQAQVSGLSFEHWRAALEAMGRASLTDAAVTGRLPFESLRRTVATLADQVADLSWRLDEARDRNRALVARTRADWEARRQVEDELSRLRRP